MPYSDSHNVFWFHPMRTASRATDKILEYFEFSDIRTHSYIQNPIHSNYIFVSNVRNPYSRIISIYNLRRYENNEINSNFDVWVGQMIRSLKSRKEVNLLYEFSLGKIFYERNKKPDFLVRVENFEEDLMKIDFIKDNYDEKLDDIFEINVRTNQYINKSLPNWKDMYNQNLADMVYEHCEKDFIYFNYDKNSWKNGSS